MFFRQFYYAAEFQPGDRLRFNLNYLLTRQVWQRAEALFKYSWNVPKQHLAVNMTWRLLWQLALAADVQFYEQTHNEFWLATAQLWRQFEWGMIFIKLNNALEADYQMTPFAPMPGRHGMTGLSRRWKK